MLVTLASGEIAQKFQTLKPRARALRSILGSLTALVLVWASFVAGSSTPAHAADCGTGTAPTAGNGDSGDPWQIATPENLLWVSWATSSGNSGTGPTRSEALADHYLQIADIDLADLTGSDAGCDWVPIGEGLGFSGSYNGGGYTITGLQTPASITDAVGMFGDVNQGVISHVHLRDVDFNGDDSIGGIAGKLRGALGRVTGSSVTGSVSGRLYVGGLVGHLQQGGSIDNSYSRASVPVSNTQELSTHALAGGLVGYVSNDLANDVVNSFSTGAVTPFDETTYDLGGLIGGTPTMTVTNSFWDEETSQQTTSGGGSGNTTAEMLQIGTFSNSGWDIVAGWEAYDFDSPTNEWGICSGINDGYPFLLSEFAEDPCVVESGGSTGGSRQASASNPGVPGIYLTVHARTGDDISGSSIGFGGFSVAPNAPYLLTVQPVQAGSAQTVLARGVMNSGGHLEREVVLGLLSPGSYKIVFVSRGSTGALLTLANVVAVDGDGRFQSITPEALQPRVR